MRARRLVTFPRSWESSPWMVAEVLATADVDGGQAVLAGGMLEDGSNLIGLGFPGGQLLARSGPVTGWAIEQKSEGRTIDPDEPADETLREMWRVARASLGEAVQRTRGHMDLAARMARLQ